MTPSRGDLRAVLRAGWAIAAALLVGLAGIVVAGCGEKQEPTPEEVAAIAEPDPREAADPLPPLPRDWEEVGNRPGGYVLGMPPEWTERRQGTRTVLSSPDELITISFVADHTEVARGMPIEELTRRTAETLGSEAQGGERLDRIEVFADAPFQHDYEAYAYRAFGQKAGTGIETFALVVVIRPSEEAASYVAILEQSGERKPEVDRDTVKRIIRSLRPRPIPAAAS